MKYQELFFEITYFTVDDCMDVSHGIEWKPEWEESEGSIFD